MPQSKKVSAFPSNVEFLKGNGQLVPDSLADKVVARSHDNAANATDIFKSNLSAEKTRGFVFEYNSDQLVKDWGAFIATPSVYAHDSAGTFLS